MLYFPFKIERRFFFKNEVVIFVQKLCIEANDEDSYSMRKTGLETKNQYFGSGILHCTTLQNSSQLIETVNSIALRILPVKSHRSRILISVNIG